jgi:hypothetical protein
VKRITREICAFFEVLDAKEQNIKSEEWDVILERIEELSRNDNLFLSSLVILTGPGAVGTFLSGIVTERSRPFSL